MLLWVAVGLLAACGGGGGGGGASGSGSGGSGGGGGGGNIATVPLPRTLAASVAETSTGPAQRRQLTTFNVTTTSTETPQNLRLTGADALPFTVEVDIGPASSQNVRTVTLTLVVTGSLDFESPADSDRNNTYIFDLEGTWLGQPLISTITVTVTDVPDAALLSPKFIAGAANAQNLGSAIQSLPDLNGDGRSDLGVSVQSDQGNAASYIFFSTGLNDRRTGRFALSAFDGHTVIENPGVTLTRSTPAIQGASTNHLSAEAAGTGYDLVLSEEGADRVVLVPVRTTDERNAVQGSVAIGSLANAIIYSFPPGFRPFGKVVRDLNGDGHNDLLVRSLASGRVQDTGVIFGRPSTGPADNQRTGTFDLTLRGDVLVSKSGAIQPFGLGSLGDLDGDGRPELSVGFPGFNPETRGENQWLVRSSVLAAAPRGSVIDLLSLTQPGQAIRLQNDLGGMQALSTVRDFDGDGQRTLLTATGSGAWLADLDTVFSQPAGSTAFMAPGAINLNGVGGASQLTEIGDLDNDGQPEFVAQGMSGLTIWRGSAVRNAVLAGVTPVSINTNNRDYLEIWTAPLMISGSTFLRPPPVWLADSGLLVMSLASADPTGIAGQTIRGGILVFEAGELARVFQSGQPRVIIQL
ncbi:MAG: VCBS repeat-containing protein [Hyphomonadaceae bacterium]|nr:VCBS repeat-containing protein [Hyphomonadaceae bacterium]